MLAHRLWRSLNIKPAIGEGFMLSGEKSFSPAPDLSVSPAENELPVSHMTWFSGYTTPVTWWPPAEPHILLVDGLTTRCGSNRHGFPIKWQPRGNYLAYLQFLNSRKKYNQITDLSDFQISYFSEKGHCRL